MALSTPNVSDALDRLQIDGAPQGIHALSKVAFAITGTRWNGPKFFGLRDKPSKGSSL
jgi:hypothetical protein